MKEIQRLKEAILKEYPRMTKDDTFTFKCHPGVPCFNQCCRDVNIFLTPYDILRLKNNLGITSSEVLSKYTISPFDKNLPYPVVMLKMEEDETKRCPFVTDQGCGVYGDRPWACRMYPLGLASPGEQNEELTEEFYFLLEESMCKGFGEDHKQTVAQWLAEQGIEEYNEAGEEFKAITLHKFFQEKDKKLSPQKIEMFFTACYNIDKFRDFLFKTSFFDKFEVDDQTQKQIKEDDRALLRFAYRWLRFALFAEPTMTMKNEVVESKKQELEKKKNK